MIKIKVALVSILAGLWLISTTAQAEIKIPGRTNSLINDYAGVLSPETKIYLEKLLRDTRGNDFTGTEIEVSTFKTLDGMPFEQFMQEYARKWRRPVLLENDNRIHIVLITGEGKLRMGIGRYVQHIVTMTAARNIIDNVISPESRNGDYDNALKKGVEAIIGLLKEGGLPKSYAFVYAKCLSALLILLISALAILLISRQKL